MKHSSQSLAHARSVHVTWMLTPFIKISEVTPSLMIGSFRIDQKGDSVTFMVRTFHWTLFWLKNIATLIAKSPKNTACVAGGIPLVIALFQRQNRGRLGEAAREFLQEEKDLFVRYYIAAKFLREYTSPLLGVTVNVTMMSLTSISFQLFAFLDWSNSIVGRSYF